MTRDRDKRTCSDCGASRGLRSFKLDHGEYSTRCLTCRRARTAKARGAIGEIYNDRRRAAKNFARAERVRLALLTQMEREICDCGGKKGQRAKACGRCLWMDGAGADGDLIRVLTLLGGAANGDAIQLELGWSYRHVLRVIAALIRAGRVRRIGELHASNGSGIGRPTEPEQADRPLFVLVDRMPALLPL